MKLAVPFAVLAMFAPVNLASRGCGTRPPRPDQIALERIAMNTAYNDASSYDEPVDVPPPPIDTYMNVIICDGKEEVKDSVLHEQMKVLNNDFQPLKVEFVLKEIVRVKNESWCNLTPTTDGDMKKKLRRGGPDTLNIYIYEMPGDTMGWASYPSDYASNPSNDCVIISPHTLPGGTKDPYNLGRTCTHEVGHWLGLYHTFEGGCKHTGDAVSDTPAEASGSLGCKYGRKTCPDEPGLDPIENFMDYSDDSCMNHFTDGQGERIYLMWAAYRG